MPAAFDGRDIQTKSTTIIRLPGFCVDVNGNAATERVDRVLTLEKGGRHGTGASGFQGTGIAVVALEAALEGVGGDGGGGIWRRLAPVTLQATRATASVLPSVLVVGARRLLPPAEAAPQHEPHAL